MKNFFYDSCVIFFQSMIPGIFIGFLYDCFRIFRIGNIAKQSRIGSLYNKKMPPRSSPQTNVKISFFVKLSDFSKKSSLFFQDILFWIFVGIIEIVYIFQSNNGELRLYSLFFSILGFVVYYNTIGKIVMYFAKHIFLLVRFILVWIGFVCYYPFFQICNIFKKLIAYIFRITIVRWHTAFTYKKELLWSETKKKELLSAAAEGFEFYEKEKQFT